MENEKTVTLKITLPNVVATVATKKSEKDFGKEDVSEYINWLIRRNCRNEIAKLENEEASSEGGKPESITYTETTATMVTSCEICGLPIKRGTSICKGIYDNGMETENFVHRTCCKD